MKRFYKHLTSWMITSVFLMILFFVLRLPPWITLVVVAGWGVGIAGEAMEVFGFPGMGREWEERKIKEEMSKMDPDQDHFEPKDDHVDDELDLPEMRQAERKWNDSDFV